MNTSSLLINKEIIKIKKDKRIPFYYKRALPLYV